MEKFWEETKRFHRWFGVIFYYSPDFPRVLRIASLTTNISSMLFIQAVTYKLSNPDDGSCETITTQTACLLPRSPFSSSESKCYWTEGYRLGSCHFSQPANNLTVVLFVAVFAAMLSTPIALSADWIIMNVLAAKSAPYSTVAPRGMISQERRAARTKVSIAMTVDKTNNEALATSLQDDLARLIQGIRAYREKLSVAQRKEFDGKL